MFNITFYLCASLIMIMKTNPLDCFTITKKRVMIIKQLINLLISLYPLSKKLYRI